MFRLPSSNLRFLLVLSALHLAACGDSDNPGEPDASIEREAGVQFDAQSAPDIGTPRDAGLTPDVGFADADIRDASDPTDAASVDATADAGRLDIGLDAADTCNEPYQAVSSPPTPPYAGTLFLDPDMITDADPNSLTAFTEAGMGTRTMYDRRTASFNQVNAHLFNATFGTNKQVEFQVNSEMNSKDAQDEASYYANAIGRLPGFLFRDIQTVWIHRGLQPFGGGNNNLLIHTEQGEAYAADGLLEEAFLHEASHTSMDAYHGAAARWLEAQAADGSFLSTYARDNPTREDVAETVGPYLAARFRANRIDASMRTTILSTVPSRVAYLDCLGLSMDVLP